MTNLSKKSPSPRLKFNPFVNVDIHSGKFLLTEQDLSTIAKLDLMLSHTINDDDGMTENVSEDEIDLE